MPRNLSKEQKSNVLFLVRNARKRAKKLNIEFTITPEYISTIYTEECPITGLIMERNKQQFRPNSFTLDRLDPSGGYCPGNVRIISWKANKAKADLTNKEIENLYLYSIGKL